MAEPTATADNNPSLRRKSAARLAAVQCLYQQHYLDPKPTPERLIELVTELQEDDDSDMPSVPLEYDDKLLSGIVNGYIGERERVEEMLLGALGARWQGERLTTLLKSILRAAAYELIFHPQLDHAIIMDEYVTLTADFYGEQEVRLINGLLQELVNHVRPQSQ